MAATADFGICPKPMWWYIPVISVWSEANRKRLNYRDTGIVAALAVGYAIAHKHRDTIVFQSSNLNSGIAQVMDILVKAVDVGSINVFPYRELKL